MKNIILYLSLTGAICFGFTSCLKDNSGNIPATDCSTVITTAPNNEVNTLKHLLDSVGVYSRVQDPRGFFYNMDLPAAVDSGMHATPCSNVAVTYSLAKFGDTVFEKSDSVVAVSLPYAITGWREAIPLMKKSATMTLYLPPSLAYGTTGYQNIPGNAYLMFTIKLYDYSN